MTNRKCGTCRFYQVSTLPTHGWCRNSAYPRRDEIALLRATEIGCRSGWGKDYWAASEANAEEEQALLPSEVPPEAVEATPVGVGLAPLLPPGAAVPAPTTIPALEPAARRRAGYQGQVPAPAAGDQDVVMGFDPRLGGHPELGENGVPLPRVRRSVVAEAHKRMLERRKAERDLSAERRATLGPQSFLASSPAPTTPGVAGEAVIEPRPVAADAPQVPPSAPPSMIPAMREAPPGSPPAAASNQPPPRLAQPTPPPAIDQQLPARPPAEGPPAMIIRPTPAYTTFPEPRPAPPAGPADATPAASSEARYWDQPATTGRFTRMRVGSDEPSGGGGDGARPAQQVQQVGRARPEAATVPAAAPPPPAERPPRTIRPLAQSQQPPVAPSPQPLEPASPQERPQFPRTRRPQPPPSPAAELPPEAAPRQVDPALLRLLETEWREQALQAHPGQRCGSCRFFQAGDKADRGTCGCSSTALFCKPVSTQDLSCLNPLGSWWAAADDGWLQRTAPPRPHRATPLLDALQRELAARPAAATTVEIGAERRRRTR